MAPTRQSSLQEADPEKVPPLHIRVKNVLGLLGTGVSEAEIHEDFPYLEHDDITACLEYAAEEMDHPVLIAG
jgi:uncharacterized protein (DUF433 family)